MTENFDMFASGACGGRPDFEGDFETDTEGGYGPRFGRGFGWGFGPGGGFGPGFGRGFGAGFSEGFGRGFGAGFGGRGGGFGRGFGGGDGPDDERRGRGRRPFDHGQMRLVILSLIAEKPRHGYDIIKTIEERFGGSYSPSPGVVYPTLTLLEEMGYTTVEESGGKKLYTITPQGEAYLKVHPEPGGAMGAESRPHRGPSPELMRALGELRRAIRSRYQAGAPSDEQMAAIVQAVEQAAAAIERL